MRSRVCENRLCGESFVPEGTTLTQPKEKQQRFCTRDCREQAYQLGKYKIVPRCAVEVSWPLLTLEQKEEMEPYLAQAQGYGLVIQVNQPMVDVSVANKTFTLHKRILVRL